MRCAEARSILCVRATRATGDSVTSNIVWNYGHTTIPRHLRDIVVTEYGIADLRGRTDREVVEALVHVMDARFQQDFVALAKHNGKLPHDYHVPGEALGNLPGKLSERLEPWRAQGLFVELPFGSDFTTEELVLAKALRRLAANTGTRKKKLTAILRAMTSRPVGAEFRSYFKRMGFDGSGGFQESLVERLLAAALREVSQQG